MLSFLLVNSPLKDIEIDYEFSSEEMIEMIDEAVPNTFMMASYQPKYKSVGYYLHFDKDERTNEFKAKLDLVYAHMPTT